MKELIINRPLAPTFGWLRVNGTPVKVERFIGEAVLSESLPADLTVGEDSISLQHGGCGEELNEALRSSGVKARSYTLPEGKTAAEPLRLKLRYTSQSAAAFSLTLGEGSKLDCIIDLSSEESGLGALSFQAKLEKNAGLRLVLLTRAGEDFSLLRDVLADCGEDASFEFISLSLGGKRGFEGVRAELRGDRSRFTADLGYRLRAQEALDLNLEAIHIGRKTGSEISASGVLSEHADKLFRGTIDLRKGAKGAKGNETEDVLLLSETVRNRSVPVILCAEEDVEGNHGASIGRLDESLIHYLGSRGLEEKDIYELMARARIERVVRKIPDAQTRRALLGEEEE